MSERSWWRRALAAVSREYERRIRRASEVSEYGANHHDQHGDHHGEEAAEIVNLPRGTPIRRSAAPASAERPAPPESTP